MKRRGSIYRQPSNTALFTMADVEHAYFREGNVTPTPYRMAYFQSENDPTYRRRTPTGKVSIVRKGLRTAKKVVIGDTWLGAATRAAGVAGTVGLIAMRKKIPGYGTASGWVGSKVGQGRETAGRIAGDVESFVARKTPYGVIKDATAKAGKGSSGMSDDVLYQRKLQQMSQRV